MKFCIIFTLVLISIVMPFDGSYAEIKKNNPPLEPLLADITDGQMLKMVAHKGGEKTFTLYYIYKTTNINHELLLNVYSQYFYNNDQEILPDSVNKIPDARLFSITRGRMLQNNRDLSEKMMKNKEKGCISSSNRIDYQTGTIFSENRFWDGYEVRLVTSKVHFDPDYPVSVDDMGSLAVMLDFSKPGIFLFSSPSMIKEALPLSMVKVKEETVKTGAGTFHTIKYRFRIADPFLAKLFESYGRETFLWIDTSPKHYVVKTAEPDGTGETLEEISSWKED